MNEQTRLSKDEVSDLKSLLDRVVNTAVTLHAAQHDKNAAERALESWIWAHTEPK